LLNQIADWVTTVIESLGYVGLALLVAAESLFPPIPSEIVLPFAGFVASDGEATLLGMIVAATIGSLVGAWSLYAISAWIGPVRLHAFIGRYGKWFRLTNADLAKAEAWFDRRAMLAVLVGRCVPLIRSLVSIPAGFRRMPLIRFTLYTLIGSLIWNSALIGAGYALRDNWDAVEPVLSWFQYVVIALIVLVVGWWFWSRFFSPAARAGDVSDPIMERVVDAVIDGTTEAGVADAAEASAHET
jgi:membrane protein DedA with SNARE-associated domain